MFSLKQSDLDYLAVKAIVGDDLERMNNLIIEMQKGYQEYYKNKYLTMTFKLTTRCFHQHQSQM